MKLNIACPSTGAQQVVVIEDEKKQRIFYEMRIGQEVDATPLGEQFKGYVLRITGGNDKDGFPMKQGVLVNGRVRLLLKGKTVGFRRPTKEGQRKRRTVRGCIVGNDLSVLNVIVAKKGEAEIPGLTDKVVPSMRGPKRASKIRKLFNLTKEDDVRKYVITKTRPNKKEGGKPHTKAPKIQRLITSQRLQRKRRELALRKHRWQKSAKEAAEYAKLLKDRQAEAKAKRTAAATKRHAAIKTRKLLAIRKALLEKRKAKLAAVHAKKQKLEEARKKKAERAASGKKTVFTPELIAKMKKRLAAKRRARWIAARKELSAARQKKLQQIRQERHERKMLVKACLHMPSDPRKRAALKKARVAADEKARVHYKIFSKKGAVKFLGVAARPFGKKAKLAKKAKAAKKAAAPAAKKAKN